MTISIYGTRLAWYTTQKSEIPPIKDEEQVNDRKKIKDAAFRGLLENLQLSILLQKRKTNFSIQLR